MSLGTATDKSPFLHDKVLVIGAALRGLAGPLVGPDGYVRIDSMSQIDVGVVIVNYNTKALLQRCLATVLRSEGVRLQVCVVDNASHDGSAEMVARDFPDVALLRNSVNVGYPAANNQGLRYLGFPTPSAPRYALLLNADTEVPPDGLAKVVAFADRRADVGVVGPKLVRPDGSLDLACRRSFPTPEVAFYRMVGLSRIFPRSRIFGRYNLTYLNEDLTVEVDSVVGAFMLVRREAVTDVGLLDEAFFMYGEDLDWAYRIKHAGWRVYYYPEVTVLHVKRAASRQNPRAKVEFWRSMEIFYRKHYAAGTSPLVHFAILAVVGFLTRWTAWRIRLLHQ